MIYLDAIWGCPRTAMVSGKHQRIPFGVDLSPNLVGFLTEWIEKSGGSWTAERMKKLSVWAIHLLAGNREFREPWFKTVRYKGYLIPRLELFRHLIDNLNHPTVIRLILTVLKSYRLRTWGVPSLDSVDGVEEVPDTSLYVTKLRYYVNLPRVPESVLKPVRAIDTRKSYCDNQGRTRPGPYGNLDPDLPIQSRFIYSYLNEMPKYMGKLVPIPDKGKWRVILVGHWIVQLRTKRLADWLRQWLWTLPEIASGEQSKMSSFAISSLRKGRYMLSIDLSQATDRLSANFQKKLLISMGVPEAYFKYLKLPAVFHSKDFPGRGDSEELQMIWYSNGQPMGLYLSFPMFELMHYVILKYVTAITDAEFCICGDDVMIACNKDDAESLFQRYETLVHRFGGSVSPTKTVQSDRMAEGVGALFLKGYPKELRIPSGKLSMLEASSPGFWLYRAIKDERPIGRAIHYSWLSTKEYKEYTEANRRALNERLVLEDLEDWAEESVRSLAGHESYPQRWYAWEASPPGTGMENPRFPDGDLAPESWESVSLSRAPETYRWIPTSRYHDALVSHKIISLYKKEQKETHSETQRTKGQTDLFQG